MHGAASAFTPISVSRIQDFKIAVNDDQMEAPNNSQMNFRDF